MSPRGLLPVAPLFFIILVCVPTSLGKPTADRDAPETIEESVTLPETIRESTTLAETIEESTTLPETENPEEEEDDVAETENPEEESDEVGATFTHMRFNLRSRCLKGRHFNIRKKRC